MNLPLSLIVVIALSACTSVGYQPVPESPADPVPLSRTTADAQKINLLERQLAEKQHQCLLDKRRMEAALKENQKQVDESQKKLEALLAIDRQLRSTKNPR